MYKIAIASAPNYGLHLYAEDNHSSEGDNFTWGTVRGDLYLYESYRQWPRPAVLINTVYNDQEGNGQFRQFIQVMIAFCEANHWDLVALNVIGSLEPYLIKRWGFQQMPNAPALVRRCAG